MPVDPPLAVPHQPAAGPAASPRRPRARATLACAFAGLAGLLAACRPALPPPGGALRPTPPSALCTAPSGLPTQPVATFPGQGTEAVARPRGTTGAAMGYFERLPAGYATEVGRRYPLVVFLHGGFEVGHNLALLDGTAAAGGPQRALTDLLRPEQGGDTPFVVLYPQRCSYVLPPQDLRAFVDYATVAYRVDPRRIYLVGHSAGAAQIWRALPEVSDRVAAVVTLSGFDVGTDLCRARPVPLWALHAQDDPVVPAAHTREVVRRLKACPRPAEVPLRLDLLPRGGHDIDATVLSDRPGRAGPVGPQVQDVVGWLLSQSL